MPAALHAYLGSHALGYPDYADAGTGRTLTALPGGRYGIRAVDPALPVPPADGRWEEVPDPAPPPLPPVALAAGGEDSGEGE